VESVEVTRAVSIDQEFERLFRAEHTPLLALAVSLVHDDHLARDLVQDAFVSAFSAWDHVARLDRPGAWVRHVLINKCIDVQRRRGREWSANERAERQTISAAPTGVDGEFWSAVAALPDLQRLSVVLHYVDDLPVDEVARVLDVHVGTVKTSLFRARRRLARVLEEDRDD
jgi:RNA polymerase sigma-70 factor (sigma-E family)